MAKKQQNFYVSLLPVVGGALLFYGGLGVILLCFFGILIVMDAYAFNIVPMISDYRYQKGASCFIAAGYHLILATIGGIALFVGRALNK